MYNARWVKAQEYERNWWERQQMELDLTIYEFYADDIQRFLDGILQINKDTSILEIGSGPVGILTFLKSDHRYAVDPLEHYYATVPRFTEFRDARVQYYSAKGEQLPFADSMFDFVIMDNVLDHCDDPGKVMAETTRVLRKGGILFFRQNVYHPWGKLVRSVMELLEIDKGHPFTYTIRAVRALLHHQKLEILKTRRTGYFQRWKKELLSGKKNDLIKALLLVNRDRAVFVLRK